jgi:uncharacterized protein YciI
LYFYNPVLKIEKMQIKLPFVLLLAVLLSSGYGYSQSNNLFFVFLNTNPDRQEISKEKVEQLQAEHLKNIDRLAKEGIIKAAGPFDGGGGIFILKAENLESANEILQSDPAIHANRFKLEIFPMMIANNDLCGAKEPYEMVTYQFIRTIANPGFNGDVDEMFRENRIFMANLNNTNDYVIVQGNFSMENDGFLILDVKDTQAAEKIIKQDPAVQQGQLNYEIKSLWIAKGTFCKK